MLDDDKIIYITVMGNVLYGVINMVEHYAIRTGVAKDWEGCERCFRREGTVVV